MSLYTSQSTVTATIIATTRYISLELDAHFSCLLYLSRSVFVEEADWSLF